MMTEELTDKQRRIESYLEEQVRAGNRYFKSKHIAKELDCSARSIGVNMGLLQDRTDRLTIEKWAGQSSGTTWRIALADPDTPVVQATAGD